MNIDEKPVRKTYTPFAWAALACFVMAFMAAVSGESRIENLALLLIIATPISCIVGIVHILSSNGKRKGLIVIITVLAFFTLASFMPAIGKVRPQAYQMVCASNLSGLGKAMRVYAEDYNDRLPTAEKWCDLFVGYSDVSAGQFVCKESDCRKGECSYAMNINIKDANVSDMPADVVVLFETESGRTSRSHETVVHSNDGNYVNINGMPVVVRGPNLDQSRWNQVGGPEILTTAHHRGKGCNVLFGNGQVRFIKKEELPKLRWKP